MPLLNRSCRAGSVTTVRAAITTSVREHTSPPLSMVTSYLMQAFPTMCSDGDRGLKVGCHGDYQCVALSRLHAGGMAVYMLYPRGSIVHKVSPTPCTQCVL